MTARTIVGGGLTGAVVARFLAEAGQRCLVLEKRGYWAGNCADTYDANGIFVHRHGPHAFHTNNREVWDFLGRFCIWHDYAHRVRANIGNMIVPVPVCLKTIHKAYAHADKLLAWKGREKEEYTINELLAHPHEEMSAFGGWVWNTFYRGYSAKQWGMAPEDLPLSIIGRVKVRFNDNELYHTDEFQAVPRFGYTNMIEKMLDHPNIDKSCDVTWTKVEKGMVYTGSLDELFCFQFGSLKYRSLKFEKFTEKEGPVQTVAQINYPDEETPFTRVVEYRHMLERGRWSGKSTLIREYPSEKGKIQYYPLGDAESQGKLEKYKALALREGVHSVGRLADYKYLNMDQAVERALALAKAIAEEKPCHVASATPQPR